MQEENIQIQVSDDNVNWTDLAILSADAVSYQHPGLLPDTTKYYRIRANGDGINTLDSDWVTTNATTNTGEVTTSTQFITPQDGDDLRADEPFLIKFDTVINEEFIADVDTYSGATDSEKIAAAIEDVNTHGGGEVIFTGRNFYLDEAIIINSNVNYKIDSGVILQIKDSVFDNVFRTEGVVVDESNPNGQCKQFFPTKNFKILGLGATPQEAVINNAAVKYNAANPTTSIVENWTSDKYGWRTVTMVLHGAQDYEIANVKLGKNSGWAILNEWDVKNGNLHEIDIDGTQSGNGDGINLRSDCENVNINNITHKGSDDSIALTNIYGYDWSGEQGNAFSMSACGTTYKLPYQSHIRNCTVSNITGDTSTNVVRILSDDGGEIHGVNVDNIEDATGSGTATAENLVLLHKGYGTGGYKANDIRDIDLNTLIGNKTVTVLKIISDCDDIQVTDIQFGTGTGTVITGTLTNSSIATPTAI